MYLSTPVLAASIPSAMALTAAIAHKRPPVDSVQDMLKRTLPASFPSNGWSYIGCYLDNVSQRVLSEASCFDDKAMTGEACVDFCGEQGYTIAGVEYGRECYCGFEFLLKTTAKAADCNMACSGDSAQACGGPNRLSAFANGAPGPVANPGVNSFVFKGCWSDSVQARTLSHTVQTKEDSGGLSIAACTSACKGQGFIYSGVEYGRECWCGAALNSIAQSIPGGPVISGCDFVCTGNASEFCGGANRLSLYQFDDRIDIIKNGGFEEEEGWEVTSNPDLSHQGQLYGYGYAMTEYAHSGERTGLVEDTSSGEATNRSVCLSQVVDHTRIGPHDFSAAIGRIPSTTRFSGTKIQYAIYVDSIFLNGGTVCLPGNTKDSCPIKAINEQRTYDLVRFSVFVPEVLLGVHRLSICATYDFRELGTPLSPNGDDADKESGSSSADIFVVDDVSVLVKG